MPVEDVSVTSCSERAVGDDRASPGRPHAEVAGPPLPLGYRLKLRDRGTTFVREVAGPEGAPTLVLLHGWMASGGLNWFRSFDAVGRHFHVLAPDLRGHARGIRSRRHFRLSDCADDTAATLDVLGVNGPVIAVGYSMGGAVAQLLWKRHPDRVKGLVLAATGSGFLPCAPQRLAVTGALAVLAGVSRMGGHVLGSPVVARCPPGTGPVRPGSLREWAVAEMRRHDVRHLVEAARAVGLYSSKRWLDHVDVPTTVFVTTQDKGVPPSTQLAMAAQIRDAEVHEFEGGHASPVSPAFGEAITDACLSVVTARDAAKPSAQQPGRIDPDGEARAARGGAM